MHRFRAPSIALATFFVAQSWAGCITNMPGFNLRQAQASLDAAKLPTLVFAVSVNPLLRSIGTNPSRHSLAIF